MVGVYEVAELVCDYMGDAVQRSFYHAPVEDYHFLVGVAAAPASGHGAYFQLGKINAKRYELTVHIMHDVEKYLFRKGFQPCVIYTYFSCGVVCIFHMYDDRTVVSFGVFSAVSHCFYGVFLPEYKGLAVGQIFLPFFYELTGCKACYSLLYHAAPAYDELIGSFRRDSFRRGNKDVPVMLYAQIYVLDLFALKCVGYVSAGSCDCADIGRNGVHKHLRKDVNIIEIISLFRCNVKSVFKAVLSSVSLYICYFKISML